MGQSEPEVFFFGSYAFLYLAQISSDLVHCFLLLFADTPLFHIRWGTLDHLAQMQGTLSGASQRCGHIGRRPQRDLGT
jgi:hypothetical protein